MIATLERLAGMLTTLPDESVEGLLGAYSAVVGADPSLRHPSVEILRHAADACPNASRAARLHAAADAIVDGLSVGVLNTYAGPEPEVVDVPPPEDPDDDPERLEAPPGAMPHMPVRYFFDGLAVRAAREFRDDAGLVVTPGEVLRVLSVRQEGAAWHVSLLVRSLRLADPAIVENAGNSWFEPVPEFAAAEELLELLRDDLAGVDDSDYEDEEMEALDDVNADIEECEEWLADSRRAPAPKLVSLPAAVLLFGAEARITVWLRWLFAAVSTLADRETSGGDAPRPSPAQ